MAGMLLERWEQMKWFKAAGGGQLLLRSSCYLQCDEIKRNFGTTLTIEHQRGDFTNIIVMYDCCYFYATLPCLPSARWGWDGGIANN